MHGRAGHRRGVPAAVPGRAVLVPGLVAAACWAPAGPVLGATAGLAGADLAGAAGLAAGAGFACCFCCCAGAANTDTVNSNTEINKLRTRFLLSSLQFMIALLREVLSIQINLAALNEISLCEPLRQLANASVIQALIWKWKFNAAKPALAGLQNLFITTGPL